MKTTHELAQELLALPNVPLVVEGWCRQPGLALTAVMTEYDPEGEAILVQAPHDKEELTVFGEY